MERSPFSRREKKGLATFSTVKLDKGIGVFCSRLLQRLPVAISVHMNVWILRLSYFAQRQADSKNVSGLPCIYERRQRGRSPGKPDLFQVNRNEWSNTSFELIWTPIYLDIHG